MGSTYEQASRNFIEEEILVNFDNMLVDTPNVAQQMADGTALGRVRRDIQILGYNMEEADGWKLLGIAKKPSSTGGWG